MGRVPVADGAVETPGPVEREEEDRPVIDMGENVENRVQPSAQGEPEQIRPPRFRPSLAQIADQADDQQNEGRMEKVVGRDPERIGEVEGHVHVGHGRFARGDRADGVVVDRAQNGEDKEGQIGDHPTEHKGRDADGDAPAFQRLGHSGVDQQMRIGLHEGAPARKK